MTGGAQCTHLAWRGLEDVRGRGGDYTESSFVIG